MSLTALLIPTFAQMLRGLAAWLDKAAAHERAAGGEPEALLSLRLAADMHPLAAQIRFACFQAQEPAYRLQGMPLPEALMGIRRAGWLAGEQPGTLAEAQAMLTGTLACLDGLAPDALDAGAGLALALDLPNGLVFDMTGTSYARDWALPQFYFHLTVAYAILRHHGVALGKADYVPHMLGYLRPAPALAPQS